MTDFSIGFTVNAPRDVPQDSITVWPVEPGWNDFGYGFQARARVRKVGTQAPETIELSLFVVPWPVDGNHRFNTWLENERQKKLPPAGDLRPPGTFVSILKNESSYRSLMQFCGGSAELAGRILRPMCDVVYNRWQNLDFRLLKEFVESDAVVRGIFRHEGAYLAWHRGIRILAGEPANPIVDAKADFEFTTRLPSFSGSHRLPVKFGVPAPLIDRCHALIGRNGVGKSQLLRELVIELGRRIDGTNTTPFLDQPDASGRDITLMPKSFTVNRVVAMTWDSQTRLPKGARLDSSFQYLHFPMTEPVTNNMVPHQSSREGSDTQTAMLIQLLREDELSSRTSAERLRRVLKPVLDVETIAVAIAPTEADPTRWIDLGTISRAGETRRLDLFGRIDLNADPMRFTDRGTRVPLSSGERTYLNFGVRCAARLTTGSLLILDEPETHLHPNLISGFMQVLDSLLEEAKSIAVIATHSPFVVRELPGRCVHVIKIDDEHVPSIGSAFLRTLGASIDQLSIDIFDDAESDQPNRDLASKIAQMGLSFNEVRATFGRDMSPDMLSEIRELMTGTGDE